jgi:hypothetical protein
MMKKEKSSTERIFSQKQNFYRKSFIEKGREKNNFHRFFTFFSVFGFT